VAIEPASGGILAMVSVPNYDPNLFVDGIDSQNWRELNESPDKPMVNRALNGAYPPGSTFKPFMALAALELGKRRPETGHFRSRLLQFRWPPLPRRQKGRSRHGGHVQIHRAFMRYLLLRAGQRHGIDNIAAFMGRLGLGQRTGIDIDGESEGVLPSQEWKKKRFRKPEQQKWYAGETISIGIGQGYNAYTPIQLAQATATVANNGVMFRPHLVKYVTDTRSGDKRLIEPEPLRNLQLKPEHVEVIKNAMIGVNKEGTGARAFAGAGYVSAGKTGTAQVFSYKGAEHKTETMAAHLRDHALFIAYAPADKPTIALAVLVENGGFGAQAAAPIARQVLDYYLLGRKPKAPAPTDEDAVEGDRE
jgi:penicillin-binding protein 2